MKNNTALIIGVSGQDGYYLTKLLIEQRYKVIGVARRSSQPRNNLDELKKLGLICVEGDLTDSQSIASIISEYKPYLCFNLGAMSHVHTSFSCPSSTFDINTIGVLNILEAIRKHSPSTRLYQASTSEMFGSNYSILDRSGKRYEFDIKKIKPENLDKNIDWETCPFQDENTPLDSESPYAISKIAAHQLIKLYRQSYGLFACSGILFNHESPHRGENFVTRKITRYVGKLKIGLYDAYEKAEYHGDADIVEEFNKTFPRLHLGNLYSKRDFSHSADMVRAMLLILEANEPKDYVVGSGSTYSVEEFLQKAFSIVGLDYKDWVAINQSLIRPAEVDLLCSKPDLIRKELGWSPFYSFNNLVQEMVYHDMELAKKELRDSQT